jgi:iron complex transport system substrate-binding protein
VPRNILRLCVIILLCMPSSGETAGKAAPPRKIVSLNLCADQLLLELADRDQIAALTAFARDTQMSANAAKAIGIPISRGRAEDVLAINPDLIVASPGLRRRTTMAALKGRQFRMVELPPAKGYAEIVEQIHIVAEALGHPERGEALVRRMDADLARIPRPRSGSVAAYYQRRGFLTGTGTLIDELMQRVGLVNLAARLDKPSITRLSIEELVAAQPDYLIVESASDHVRDQGTAMLHHPAIAHIPRLHLPQAWTVCGSPAYVSAAESLAAQIRATAGTGHAR